MYKLKRSIKSTEEGGSIRSTLLERAVGGLSKNMYKLIFAVAISNKITPKKLANAFNKKKVEEFAFKFREELNKQVKKTIEDAEKLKNKYNRSDKMSSK